MAREKTYSQDFPAAVAAGAKLSKVVLAKKGTDKKLYNQDSQEFAVPFTYAQALAFCGNDETEFGTLFVNRIANPMLQANDRRKLAIKAEGPEKTIQDMVDSLLDGKAFDDATEAREFVISRLVAKGEIPEGYGVPA